MRQQSTPFSDACPNLQLLLHQFGTAAAAAVAPIHLAGPPGVSSQLLLIDGCSAATLVATGSTHLAAALTACMRLQLALRRCSALQALACCSTDRSKPYCIKTDWHLSYPPGC